MNDPRLTYFEVNFCRELQQWKEEIDVLVSAIPSGDKEKRKFLTKETYFALHFTTKSTVSCIRYLLEELQFAYVLTRRFSSDGVKQLFGAIRQMTGGNFKGDATAVSQVFEKIVRTGIAYSSINGNTRLERKNEIHYKRVRNQEMSRKRARDELKFLPSSFLQILDEMRGMPSTYTNRLLEKSQVIIAISTIIYQL